MTARRALAIGRSALARGLFCGAPWLWACSSSTPAAPATDARAIALGRAAFADPSLSTLDSNQFSCSTCHAAEAGQDDVLRPGALLAGATLRRSFWNDQENDLLEATNVCVERFMQSGAPLAPTNPKVEALYGYLVSLEPGDPNPQPFTIVGNIADVPRGDAQAGATLFARSCATCHGSLHRGAGRSDPLVPVLPEDALRLHANYDAKSQRLVFVEKARHGCFLGYGGTMPPFSREILSDSDLSDLLEALGVLAP